MKVCPECKLINPPEAQICDCGYNFETNSADNKLKDDKFDSNENTHIFIVSNICNFILGYFSIWVFIFAHFIAYGFFTLPSANKVRNFVIFALIIAMYVLFFILFNISLYKQVSKDDRIKFIIFNLIIVFIAACISIVYLMN